MAQGRMTFLPPPPVPGVSEDPSVDALMKQLAGSGGEGGPGVGAQQAQPLIANAIMQLQQAAELDPRSAPFIRRALEPLLGGPGSPPLSVPPKNQSGGVPTPGGRIPTGA